MTTDTQVCISGFASPSDSDERFQRPHPHKHYIHRSNWLRAAVLGVNDGLVSTASLVMGVAGGSTSTHVVVLAGVSGLAAGALSMAVGEYISVSSQRDIELADVEKERVEQAKGPQAQALELAELTQIYVDRGITRPLAAQVAKQLTDRDVVRAHARDELGIDVDNLTNPWSAALASGLAFTFGAFFPIVPLLLPGVSMQQSVVGIIVIVTLMLAASGVAGSLAGGAPFWNGGIRVLLGGWLAMAVTWGIGNAFHAGSTPA